MPQLVMKVDRSTGNYETVFLYTLNASFNGIIGNIESAEIRMFIPKELTVFMGDIGEPIKELRTQTDELGTTYIFDFGSITDLGIAVRIGFGVEFLMDALPDTEVILTPELWINQEAILTTKSETIQLVVVPRFELTKELVLPEIAPAPGGAVFYKVTLENFGDLGAKIENVVINCEGLDLLQIDTQYSIVGKDASTIYADTSQDNIMGRVENNIVIFELSEYRGQRYIFYYRAVVDSEALVGAELDTVATWTISGVEQIEDVNALNLQQATSDIAITLYGPDFTLSERLFCYEIYMENVGNQVINDISFIVDLPQEIKYNSFSTGTFYLAAIEQDLEGQYEITYTTNNGISGSFGQFNTNENSTIELANYLEVEDNLATISWNLQTLGIGVKEKESPHIKGVTNSDLATGKVIISSFEGEWLENGTTINKVNTKTSVIQDICVLLPIFTQSVNGNPVKPGDVIQYSIGAYALQSRLNNPLFALLMPKELSYAGNAALTLYRHFDETEEAVLPTVSIEENFNDNQDTLVKFDFRDEFAFEFSQKAYIMITFDALVLEDSKGTISSKAVLNVSSSTGQISEGVNVYRDTNGISDDPTVSVYYAATASISNQILLFLSTQSKKLVKGYLDDDYLAQSIPGNTLAGGSVSYKIIVSNTGNADIDELEIVDILPYIGDKGVIEEYVPRESEFTVYNITEVIATIDTREVALEPTIMYTQSTDPVRFGNNFNMIGTVDDWSETPPEDITLVKGFKVIVQETIFSQETLTIIVNCTVPVGITENMIAWNSFAADLVYTNMVGESEHLLAIEPEKAGIQIVANDPSMAVISGFTWFDTQADGVPESEEVGLNDVGVVLYDEKGTPLRATFTTYDSEQNPGYYSFSNVEIGSYYVRFFIDSNTEQFTVQRLDVTEGSKPNSSTGITDLISVAEGEISIVNAGIVARDKKQIEAILAMNKSANSMMRNVIYDQMLISLKYEDTKELIELENK